MRTGLIDRLYIAQSIVPTGNRTATVNGTGIDLSSSDAVAVIFGADTITDGTHTPKIQDSDDNSTFADVAAADQDGALVAITAASVQKVGYLGSKRYIRAVVTVTGSPATGGKYVATVVSTGGYRP